MEEERIENYDENAEKPAAAKLLERSLHIKFRARPKCIAWFAIIQGHPTRKASTLKRRKLNSFSVSYLDSQDKGSYIRGHT